MIKFFLCLLLVYRIAAYGADNIQVYFSPNGGCTRAIVQALDVAKSNVYIQAYSFTSKEIARALLDAHKRGVKVFVILDKSSETDKYSSATFLQNEGLPPLIDKQHTKAHNKVMIIDGETVITGSFNFTAAGETRNAENLLVIKDAALAKQYLEDFDKHAKHSNPYQRKASP